MCEYCEDKVDRYYKNLTTTAEYSGLEISLHPKGTLRVRAYLGDDLFKAQDIVNVNYCPMCGRKLGG